MKILFCSHEQFLPLTGGCTAGNVRIVQKMVARGHKVTVSTPIYIPRGPIEEKYRVSLRPFSPFYMHRKVKFRMLKYLVYSFLYTFFLYRLVKREKYDLIFVRNVILGFSAAIVKKLTGIKTAISLTDFLSAFLYEDKKYPRFLIDFFLRLEKNIPWLFDKIFVITPRMKEELKKARCDMSKIAITYDGVDTSFFDPEKISQERIEKVKEKIGFKDNIVLFHGTIEPHHGLYLIKDIISKISSKEDNVNFLIIGAGKGYEELQKSIGAPGVKFMDFIPYEQIPQYIAASNVGIIPYKKNYGMDLVLTLKLLEYLAMGNPVVTFDLDSVREIFGQYDFVKISRDTDDFSNKVIGFLRRQKSHEAVNLIQKRFSWDTVTTKICEEIELLKE